MAAASVYICKISHGHPCLSRPAAKCRPGSYQIAAFCWVPKCERFCVHPLRMKSLFPPVLCGAAEIKPHGPSKPSALGAYPPSAGPPGGRWGAQTPHSCGRTTAVELFSGLWSPRDPGSVALDLPLLPLLAAVPSLVSLVVDLCWWVPACSSVVVLQTVVILGVFVRGGELRF